MLLRVLEVVLGDQGDVVQQYERDQICCDPRLSLLFLCHGLQCIERSSAKV